MVRGDALRRREALRLMLGTAAGLSLGLPALAGASALPRLETGGHNAREPDRLALLSDPHIHGRADKRFWGADLSGNLTEAIGRVLDGPRPTAVLINGDCALNDGGVEAYAQFHRTLHPLRDAGLPMHCTLGNHDDREHFYDVFAEAFPQAGMALRKCMDVVHTPRADWYLLDSLRKTDETPGELGQLQLIWLQEQLDAQPTRAAVIVVHHPPEENPDGRGGVGLDDSEKLMRMLRPRRQVKALIHGHLHRFEFRRDGDLPVVGLPATSYVLNPGQAVGYVDATLDDRELRLSLRCIAGRRKREGETMRLALR